MSACLGMAAQEQTGYRAESAPDDWASRCAIFPGLFLRVRKTLEFPHGQDPQQTSASVRSQEPGCCRRDDRRDFGFPASGFATSRAHSMKSFTAGVRVRFFNVMTPIDHGGTGRTTCKILSFGSVAPNRSSEAGKTLK